MEEKDLPQDNCATYAGHQKVMYATRNGHYVKAVSTGWQDEAFATEQAVGNLRAQADAARAAVAAGTHSPLYYCMHAFRHDEVSLAQAVGLFRWQVRRHFRPAVFARLSDKMLARYAQALQLDVAAFRQPFEPAKLCPPGWE